MAPAVPDLVDASLKALSTGGGSESDVLENLRTVHGFIDWDKAYWDKARRTQLANAGGVGAVVAAARAHEGSEDVQQLAAVRSPTRMSLSRKHGAAPVCAGLAFPPMRLHVDDWLRACPPKVHSLLTLTEEPPPRGVLGEFNRLIVCPAVKIRGLTSFLYRRQSSVVLPR